MGSEIIVAPLKIKIDATDAVNQINELIELFKFETRTLESVPEHVVKLFLSSISSLIDNIVLDNFSPTTPTGSTGEICIKVKVVGPTDLIASAIRTGDFQSLVHAHSKSFS